MADGQRNRESVAWRPAVVIPIVIVLWWSSRFGAASLDGVTSRLVTALLILPGIVYFLVAQARWNRGADELRRRILLERYSFMLACVLAVAFTVQSLEKAGFEPHLEMIDGVGIGMVIGGAVSWVIARRRYGAANPA